MVTDGERRMVAERLRKYAKTVSSSPEYLWNRLEIAVNGWQPGDEIYESYAHNNTILARLADLIEIPEKDE